MGKKEATKGSGEGGRKWREVRRVHGKVQERKRREMGRGRRTRGKEVDAGV